MTFKCLAAAGVGLVLTATVAHADTQIITAKAGRSTLIGVSGDIDPVTCKAADGINRFVVLTLPANGSVTTALQKVPYKGGGAAASCEGKPYNANVLLYMPNKGFKGRDSLSVGHAVSLRDLELITPVTIEIDVK